MKRLSSFFLALTALLGIPLQASDHDVREAEADSVLPRVGVKRPPVTESDPEGPDSRHKKPRYASPIVDDTLQQAKNSPDSPYNVNFTPLSSDEPFEATIRHKKEPLCIDIKRSKAHWYSSNTELIPLASDGYMHLPSVDLFTPKIYTILEHFTGPGCDFHDSFKGSFSFDFLLSVTKGDKVSQYVYYIYQYRSFVDTKIYKIIFDCDSIDPSPFRVIKEPTEDLFSRKDINEFSHHFFSHLIKEGERISFTPAPFILTSHSNFLVSGYLSGEYFENSFHCQESYDRQIKWCDDCIKGYWKGRKEVAREIAANF